MSTLSVNNIESVVNLTVANTITIGNSTVNSTITSTGVSSVNTTSIVVGSNVSINTSSISVGNSTVTGSSLSIGNSTVNAVINSSALVIGNSTVNTTITEAGLSSITTTSIAVGSNVSINTSSLSIGNSTVNTSLSSSQLSMPSGTIIVSDIVQSVAQFSWNSGTTTPAAVYSDTPVILTNAHKNMRRCLLLDNGTVNYYLDPYDSTKKADGTAATLTGADGMVMVEIPKFYTKRQVSGTVTTWFLSDYALPGYTVHPAFQKNGVEVNYRYIGAYDACYLDATDSTYKSGLNLDDLTSSLDTAADKLSSVSGVYPIVGTTRAEARLLAANRGTGWRQVDFWLISAIQYLYLTEYRSYYTQNILGDGNTNVTNAYSVASSSTQANSPHSIAGKSNFLGNRSTTTVTGAVSGTRDVAYMSYRGIENWYGNCWTWVDGFNIDARQAHVSNTDTTFDDSSLTTNNYTALGTTMPTSDNYVTNGQAIDNAWLPASVGGASTTYWTDYYFQTTGLRVACFGGSADNGALAGGFCWALSNGSSSSGRMLGARLAF